MTTQTTTRYDRPGDAFGGGVAGSFLLHATVVGMILLGGWWYHTHAGQNWGDTAATAGAIPATMVDALPLPPKPPSEHQSILANDASSPAPVAPTPKTVEAPRPEDIPIPAKAMKAAKTADKTTPAPPLHPQPTKVDPNKAQTGQSGSLSVAMSSIQTHAGTTSVNVSDTAFGTRFAYYVNQINSKVSSQWFTAPLDARARGHRLYVTFQIERDGSVTRIQIAQPSGDSTLDQTGLSAVQHVDTFPPLPDAYTGSHLNVTYYFDPPPVH